MKKIRIAVVGLGRIGSRHAFISDSYENTELVATADPKSRTNEHAHLDKIPHYSSIEELLQNCKPDVVSVCTPNGLHIQHANTALEAGCNVLIEKPMGLSYSQCIDLTTKAKSRGLKVFVVKQNRYSPPVLHLKNLIDQKALGKIYTVQINCFWNRSGDYYEKSDWKGSMELDGGTLFTQFSHFIDIVYWYFGNIQNISGRTFKLKPEIQTQFEDTGSVTFEFENEQFGIGILNFSTTVWKQNLESSIKIIGERGSIVLGGQYMNEFVEFNVEGHNAPNLPPTNPPNDYGPYKGSAANHHYVFDNIVKALNNKTNQITSADEGAEVVGIIERIYSATRS